MMKFMSCTALAHSSLGRGHGGVLQFVWLSTSTTLRRYLSSRLALTLFASAI